MTKKKIWSHMYSFFFFFLNNEFLKKVSGKAYPFNCHRLTTHVRLVYILIKMLETSTKPYLFFSHRHTLEHFTLHNDMHLQINMNFTRKRMPTWTV